MDATHLSQWLLLFLLLGCARPAFAGAVVCPDTDKALVQGALLFKDSQSRSDPKERESLKEQALALFRCVHQRDTSAPRPLAWMGIVTLAMGRFVEAEGYFLRARERWNDELDKQIKLSDNLHSARVRQVSLLVRAFDVRDRSAAASGQPLRYPLRGGTLGVDGKEHPLPMQQPVGPLSSGKLLVVASVPGYRRENHELNLLSCADQGIKIALCDERPLLNQKAIFLTPKRLWERPGFWAAVGGVAGALVIGLSVGLTYAPGHQVAL